MADSTTAAKQETGDREIHYDGVHCHLTLRRFPESVILLRIEGTDIGEFGEVPMRALDAWVAGGDSTDLYIDAREVRGASIHVSAEWASWLGANRGRLRAVTMLTGSRFIEMTAEFVRRFAELQGIMRICTDPEVFDHTLAAALRASRA